MFLTAEPSLYAEEQMNEQVAKVRSRERISLGDFFFKHRKDTLGISLMGKVLKE